MTTKYSVDYAKRGTSGCKKCKKKLDKGDLRLAKVTPNPFSDNADEMKLYFHANCMFETLANARATTKVIESSEDVENWADLQDEDKTMLLKKIDELAKKRGNKKPSPGTKKTPAAATKAVNKKSPAKDVYDASTSEDESDSDPPPPPKKTASSEEKKAKPKAGTLDSWSAFCEICDRIASVSAYTKKTESLENFLEEHTVNGNYDGDIVLLMKLLLPGAVKRVYNVNSKQLVKLYADLFDIDVADVTDHLNNGGDISETVVHFFKRSKLLKPVATSTLTCQEVDSWLQDQTQFTKESDHLKHLKKITKRCTANDLLYIIRQIKHDLRINAGAKHILEALDANAYAAFQASRDLERVVKKILENKSSPAKMRKSLSIGIQLGVPVLPMLAEACRSVEGALKKCPNGMLAEIKYDGERVQVHKNGAKFRYFSRSLKPVQDHKVGLFGEYIPKAFPKHDANLDIILDAEVLLVDLNGKPLPFGTLGVHKKQAFKDANVALFVFDCLMFNGESLLGEPLKKRKEILRTHMVEIPRRILFSEAEFIPTKDPQKSLPKLLNRCFREGLEGLVLKDAESLYEPGKRHWLKMKKDYLQEGVMADTADLIVLGAYYGTGNKGGMMSVFLMGCYDQASKTFRTVTKCGNGHDDAALEKINKKLTPQMIKINRDYDRLPTWLECSRQLVPDFVIKDPKTSPVWEITGAEFSKSDAHTAAGISIRFPRVTKIRNDKDWAQATNLVELKTLFAKSKEHTDVLPVDEEEEEDTSEAGPSTIPKLIREPSALNKLLGKWESMEDKANDEEKTSPAKTKPSPKRPASAASSDEPSAKKKRKEPCKYGATCYRKNTAHRAEFSHPGDDDKDATSDEDDDSPIQVFKDCVFFIDSNCDKSSEMNRYISYFGGDISSVAESSTHVLVPDKKAASAYKNSRGSAKIVKDEWIWLCFRNKTAEKLDDYIINIG